MGASVNAREYNYSRVISRWCLLLITFFVSNVRSCLSPCWAISQGSRMNLSFWMAEENRKQALPRVSFHKCKKTSPTENPFTRKGIGLQLIHIPSILHHSNSIVRRNWQDVQFRLIVTFPSNFFRFWSLVDRKFLYHLISLLWPETVEVSCMYFMLEI